MRQLCVLGFRKVLSEGANELSWGFRMSRASRKREGVASGNKSLLLDNRYVYDL